MKAAARSLGAGLLVVACADESGTAIDDGEGRADARVFLPDALGSPVDASSPVDPCFTRTDCADDVRCVRDVQAAASDRSPLSLVCGPPIGRLEVGELCDDNDDCVSGVCAVAGGCIEPCRADSDCFVGFRCDPGFTQTGPRSMQTFRGCVRSFDPPPGVRVSERQVGPRPGSDGETILLDQTLDFELSGELMLDTDSSGLDDVVIARVATPQEVLFDLDELFSVAPLTGINPSGNPAFFRYPNGSGAPPSARDFRLQIELVVPNTELFITRFERDAPGTVLDLNLFYVGVRERPMFDGSPPPIIEAALSVVRRVYEGTLRLGRIRQRVVVGRLASQLDFVDGDLELSQLWRLSTGASRPAVNVFLVQSVDGALGLAGGIPGPAIAHGTRLSGVAVSLGLLRDDPEFLGIVFAHEIGHFLGLFHTSEFRGSTIESLDDTPVCTPNNDADRNRTLAPDECQGLGADNLMFWAASGDVLTSEQRAVVARSMALQ